jgi:DNA replication licensing factor MCM7
LAEQIERNCKRFIEVFSEAIDDLLPPPDYNTMTGEDVEQALLNHRLLQLEKSLDPDGTRRPIAWEELRRAFNCPQLLRRYQVRFIPRSDSKPTSLRNIKSSDMGKLVKIKAIILRTSEVKPIVEVASYIW